MSNLLTQQETFKGINDNLGDGSAFFDRLFLYGVPQFVTNSDGAKGSCHLSNILFTIPARKTNLIIEINPCVIGAIKCLVSFGQKSVTLVANVALCHLDCLSNKTNFRHVKNISHANNIVIKSLNNVECCFISDEVLILSNKEITAGIAGELATICNTLVSLLTYQAFDSAGLSHFASVLLTVTYLVAVYTGYTNVYTGATPKIGRVV